VYPGAFNMDVFCGNYGRGFGGIFPFYSGLHFMSHKCKPLTGLVFTLNH